VGEELREEREMNWHTETRKVSELKEWDINPRLISKEEYKSLKESMNKLGNWDSLVINTDGTVIAGNQRLKIHKERGDSEVEVKVPDRELSLEEIKEIGIKSNRHSGEWDMDILANEFEDLLEELGFDDLLPEVELEVKEDDYEEPEDLETTVVLGDVYQLGEHRLMCGDSTKIEGVEKLMNGEKADMVFTDPPYGMDLDTDYSKITGGEGKGKKHKEVMGDDKPFDPSPLFEMFGYCEEIILFGADYYLPRIPDWDKGTWLIWDKRETENYDKVIGSSFEVLWSKKKRRKEIIRYQYVSWGRRMEDGEKVHPTMKPVKLLSDVILKTNANLIVDVFGGSGSTLIACEQTNRRCYMMELDPHYCQVIIDRWEKLTGKETVKIS